MVGRVLKKNFQQQYCFDRLFCKFCSYIQDTFQNLKRLVERHCLNLWSLGSQLILSKCSFLMCSLLSNCRQKHMHLFCETSNLFLYFLFKFRYHAAYTQQKCGLIDKSFLKSFKRNLFFLYKNFSFEVTFVQTCIVIDSP